MDISVQQHLLPAVVVLVMIAVGMELRFDQFKRLAATPRVPLLGTLIHTLSFPLIAVALVLLIQTLKLDVGEATLAGILLIAACPSGGFSNVLTLMARANLPLSVLLTSISSLLAFVTVPLLIGAFSWLLAGFDRPVALPVGTILMQLLLLILVPVGTGMLLRFYWETLVERIVNPLQNFGQILLYIGVALLVVENFDVVSEQAASALPWSLALCALNLLVCYQGSRLVGLEPQDCTTVALEGSVRNLAVALLIALNTLERMDIAVLPTVYFVAVLIVTIGFAKSWRRLTGQAVREHAR